MLLTLSCPSEKMRLPACNDASSTTVHARTRTVLLCMAYLLFQMCVLNCHLVHLLHVNGFISCRHEHATKAVLTFLQSHHVALEWSSLKFSHACCNKQTT